jgi:indolepyruvate ferredoxin oxidoreductase, beta subunit
MKITKLIISGVGGQGVVFLAEILVDAAVRAGMYVATSEIHGLSQRGGSVVAGMTFGENAYGFVEEGGADFLLGLELLEAQRCVNFLHTKSVAIIDNTKIIPHAVNSGKVHYPDPEKFLGFLKENIREVIFIEDPKPKISPVMRNLLVLAKAAAHPDFPVKPEFIEKAILGHGKGNPELAYKVFQEGRTV